MDETSTRFFTQFQRLRKSCSNPLTEMDIFFFTFSLSAFTTYNLFLQRSYILTKYCILLKENLNFFWNWVQDFSIQKFFRMNFQTFTENGVRPNSIFSQLEKFFSDSALEIFYKNCLLKVILMEKKEKKIYKSARELYKENLKYFLICFFLAATCVGWYFLQSYCKVRWWIYFNERYCKIDRYWKILIF